MFFSSPILPFALPVEFNYLEIMSQGRTFGSHRDYACVCVFVHFEARTLATGGIVHALALGVAVGRAAVKALCLLFYRYDQILSAFFSGWEATRMHEA